VVRHSWKFFNSLRSMRTIGDYYGVALPWFPLQLGLRGPARSNLAVLGQAILRKEGKQTLVIKDPRHACHVDRIEGLYGDAKPKYILLYRDARGVAHSFHRNLNRKLDRGFRVWLEAVRGMIACQLRFPERCMPVRFEDLLQDPRRTMEQVVRFLGHEFETEMLHYGKHVHADDVLNLWRNKRLVSSVNSGVIHPSGPPAWRDDPELLQSYRAREQIVHLNQQLGYGSFPDEPASSLPLPDLDPQEVFFEQSRLYSARIRVSIPRKHP
jgi:hypothetical protein